MEGGREGEREGVWGTLGLASASVMGWELGGKGGSGEPTGAMGRLILNKSWNLEMGGGQRSALGLDESGRCKGVGRGWTGGDPELALIRSGEVI